MTHIFGGEEAGKFNENWHFLILQKTAGVFLSIWTSLEWLYSAFGNHYSHIAILSLKLNEIFKSQFLTYTSHIAEAS